ncbi:MAG: hypothetical protein KBT20_06110 [Bacteroidales bacterium]|nr:hypothetical protein [Candidatus Liminaster caballi]
MPRQVFEEATHKVRRTGTDVADNKKMQLTESAASTHNNVAPMYVDNPQIKIRTWQPDMTPMDDLYGAGDFYK